MFRRTIPSAANLLGNFNRSLVLNNKSSSIGREVLSISPYYVIKRAFSSDDNSKNTKSFHETLMKMKKSFDKKDTDTKKDDASENNNTNNNVNSETVNENKESEQTVNNDAEKSTQDTNTEPKLSYFANFSFKSFFGKATEVSKTSSADLKVNVTEAWKELTGKSNESKLKKKVYQADSYRRPKKDENGEDVVTDKVDGPTAMVHVPTPKTAWEQLSERMSDAPLIKEILKESRKVRKAASETKAGQQAKVIGEKVTHKLEVRDNISYHILVV